MSEPALFWIAAGETRLGYQVWRPAGEPRASVLAMHGLGCREADFAPLGEALRARGILLAAWNLRGQGLDPATKRRGAWLDREGMEADLESFRTELGGGEVPLFLCGESMGSLLALQIAIRPPWNRSLAGLLLFSPVVGLARENPPWLRSLIRFGAALAPGLRIRPGWFVHGSASLPQLTRIPERQQELATAPHRLGPLTVRFLSNIAELIEAAPPAAAQLDLPVAIFSAGHDVFVTAEQTRVFFERIRGAEKTHFPYPESYHQLMFDLDAAQVIDDAAGWIEGRLGG